MGDKNPKSKARDKKQSDAKKKKQKQAHDDKQAGPGVPNAKP
jgi:hypothetical protein